MRRCVYLILALCLILVGCGVKKGETSNTVQGDETVQIQWESGDIDYESGQNSEQQTVSCLRTAEYLALEEYAGAMPQTQFSISWFAYDAQKAYLGSSAASLGNGIGISFSQILQDHPRTKYVRLQLSAVANGEAVVLSQQLPIKVYTAAEGWPEFPVKQEAVADLRPHQGGYLQDGEAFGDVLFTFKASGVARAYNVNTGEFLDEFTLGEEGMLIPHVNSASFSDQYYEEGDPFPLLYTSVYNNKDSSNKYVYGACCVYRITCQDGQFDAQMVQMIRVSFTSDRELWLSPESNSRPFGNFVVDTDRDILYAFVPRDDSQTTRFFGFALPKPTDGSFNSGFRCNVVVLKPDEIVHQFDVEYFSSPQGCCYWDGKVYSTEGFGTFESAPPVLRVIDLEKEKQILAANLGQLGLDLEPETITVTNGQLYYISMDVILRKLEIIK